MRQIMLGDIVAVARALIAVPPRERDGLAKDMIYVAHLADKVRKRIGVPHQEWGNGSLMAMAAKVPKPAEPFCGDLAYLEALRATIEEILTWKKQNQRLNRRTVVKNARGKMDDCV